MLKNLILLLLSLFLFTTAVKAQDQQITSKKFLGHYNYFYGNKRQNYLSLQKKLKQNAEASKLMKQARLNNGFSGTLSTGLLVLMVESAMFLTHSDEFSWAATGVGVGMYVAAFHFNSVANKKSKKAVDLYNAALLPGTGYYFQPELKVGFTGNGLGFQLKF